MKRGGKVDKYHTHEALHMSLFLAEAVDEQLCMHPTIKTNKKLSKLAQDACDNLYQLYQAIGGI